MKVNTKLSMLISLLAAQPVMANSNAEIGLHSRIFPDSSPTSSHSVSLELRHQWRSDNSSVKWGFVGYGMLDSRDENRSYADIKQAALFFDIGEITVSLGIDHEFWGVSEGFHLVNILNQIDNVRSLDGEDLLGQPQIKAVYNANWLPGNGIISMYILPTFRTRRFHEIGERLAAFPVQEHQYNKGRGSAAIRYSGFVGALDFGTYYFNGISRDPVIAQTGAENSLRASYEVVTQAGLDMQITSGSWLWKYEAIRREAEDYSFYSHTGGFEYSFYGFRDSSLNLGIVAEWIHDGRPNRAPQTPFSRAVFTGARLALNNVNDTSILVGAYFDSEHGGRLVRLEAQHRLSEKLHLSLETNWFLATPEGSSLYGFRDDSFVELTIQKGF